MRVAGRGDFAAIGEAMHAAVREGPSPYTEAQRTAWMPEPRSGEAWSRRLASQHVVIEERDGRVEGLMSVDRQGYVDLAYIRPEARGKGLFRRLYEAIEAEARSAGLSLLTVHASLMARPAFEAVGFTVVAKETVEIGGQRLARFAMEKRP